MKVVPEFLTFHKTGQEEKFELTITAKKSTPEFRFGELLWSDGSHFVRSPIVVWPKNNTAS